MKNTNKKRSGINRLTVKTLFLLLVCLICLSNQVVWGQQTTDNIAGTVLDEENEPITGATVTVQAGKIATITDIDGKFSLKNVPEGSILKISYIGYKDEKVTVSPSHKNITIHMMMDVKMLQTVEVQVGYGTMSKPTLTGAVSQIKGDDIVVTKNENIQNMLAGKIAGVTVVQKSSEPGDYDNSFEIRGFEGGPLYVIDGVPSSGAEFQRLNADDVESISILKDASAAIYGVEAANGVVLITTKQGGTDARFQYSANFTIQTPASLGKTADINNWIDLRNELSARDRGLNSTSSELDLLYDEDYRQQYADGRLKTYDWYSPVIQEQAFQQQHNLSVSGSSGKIKYYIGLGYLYQDGFMKSHDINYERYNFRSNFSANLTKRLSATVRLSAMIDKKERPLVDSWQVFKSLWSTNSNTSIFIDDDPNYPRQIMNGNHPLVISNSDLSGYNNNQRKNMRGDIELSYVVPYIKGLTLNGLYSYNYNQNVQKRYDKTYILYNDSQDAPTPANDPEKLRRTFDEGIYKLWNVSLSYKTSINKKHNISALLVYEEKNDFEDSFFAQRNIGIPIDELYAGVAEGQIGFMNVNSLIENAKQSLIGRFTYDFSQKYLLSVSFRNDGSSKFPKGKQRVLFPGISGGWRISEEKFMSDNEALNFIDNIKLRASYGKMGSDRALDYQFVNGYSYPDGDGNAQGRPNGAVFDGKFINSYYIRPLANEHISWIEVKTFNLGLDLDLWNGLLSSQLEYFNRYRDGLLATRRLSVPGSYGLALAQENLNADETSGYEITLEHRNKIDQVRYTVSGNFAYARTMWKEYDTAASANSYQEWRNSTNAGRYNDIVWGYKVAGQFKSYEEIANHPVIQPANSSSGGNRRLLPGDYYYEDFNGDGIISDFDKQPIGLNKTPKVNYGFFTKVNYRNFDFTTSWQGAAMFNVMLKERLIQPFANSSAVLDQFTDRWHPVNPTDNPFDRNTQWVKGFYPSTGGMDGSYVTNSTAAFTNCSYLRLKSIELGYTLSNKVVKQLGLRSVRFYVNGYNLVTFTGLKFVDPEHPEDLYGYRYPLNKTYNIGLNATF